MAAKAFDEMNSGAADSVRAPYRAVANWLAQTSPERVAATRHEVDVFYRRHGITFGAYLNLGCHADMDVARSLVRGGLTTFARFSVMHGKTEVPTSAGDQKVLKALHSNYDMKAHTRGDSRQAGTLTDDFVDRFAIVGPPERCIERLKELQALGLDKVAISGATRGAAEADAAVGRKLVVEKVLAGMKR